MFIEKLRSIYKPKEPILIEDMLLLFPNYTRAYVFRLANKSIEKKELARYSRGVYCIPKEKEYGTLTLNPEMVATKKYVKDGENVFGLYSGLSLLNRFVVISQVPASFEIISNKEKSRKRIIKIDYGEFILRKPRFEITKENKDYYEILQLFLEISKGFKIDYLSRKLIVDFIKEKKLKEDKLLMYATSFPQVVMKQLLESGVIYEVFHKQEESE